MTSKFYYFLVFVIIFYSGTLYPPSIVISNFFHLKMGYVHGKGLGKKGEVIDDNFWLFYLF